MPRPAEYDNLLQRGLLKAAVAQPASVEQFMRTASDLARAAEHPMVDSARFTLAYEAMFNVVMAVLEFHEVRPGDSPGHRVTALQRVAADLNLDAARQSALARLHDVRNRVTYRAPIPPVTAADVAALQAIVAQMLPAAKQLLRI